MPAGSPAVFSPPMPPPLLPERKLIFIDILFVNDIFAFHSWSIWNNSKSRRIVEYSNTTCSSSHSNFCTGIFFFFFLFYMKRLIFIFCAFQKKGGYGLIPSVEEALQATAQNNPIGICDKTFFSFLFIYLKISLSFGKKKKN